MGEDGHEISVLLLEDGEPLYWDSRSISAFPEDDGRAGSYDFEGFPTNHGTYTLYAWRNHQPRSEWETLDIGEISEECIEIIIIVEGGGGGTSGELDIRFTDCSSE